VYKRQALYCAWDCAASQGENMGGKHWGSRLNLLCLSSHSGI